MNKNSFDTTILLSHLLATDIRLNGLEATIIDAIYNASIPITNDNIATEIQNTFKINIDNVNIQKTVKKLTEENKLYYKGNNILISPDVIGDVSEVIYQNQEVEDKALAEWIENFENTIQKKLSDKSSNTIKTEILQFIKSFFLSHGADSISLIFDIKKSESFDIYSLVNKCINNVEKEYKDFFQDFLQGIFSRPLTPSQREFCIKQIDKAISYMSMVASDEVKQTIVKQMKGLVIYLDTPILYRLLNLQGENRYNIISTLLEYCTSNKISLKIFQSTYSELKRRIAYDAKIIEQYPTPVDFAKIGYRCRTSDNYISTFWRVRKDTGITAKDFNFMYSDLKTLIGEKNKNIVIDTIDYISEFSLEKNKEKFYEKVSAFSNSDAEYKKSINSIEHDAICLASIEKLRIPNSSSAIDSKVVFLSSDWSLIRLQRYDYEYKEEIDLVFLPSQLMQLFCITQATESFYDAFLGLFSSSKTSFGTKSLTNAQIQGILGRVAIYKGATATFAEKILTNQLIQETFALKESEEEQLQLIDDAVLAEVEKLESQLNYKIKEVETIKEENINKGTKIEDLNKRLCVLEKAREKDTKLLSDKEKRISKYEDHYKNNAEIRSKIKALFRIAVGVVMILVGALGICISICAIIPNLSQKVVPCLNWMSSSVAIKEDRLNNVAIIGILLAVSGISIPIGISLLKPGYLSLKDKYYEKYLDSIK